MHGASLFAYDCAEIDLVDAGRVDAGALDQRLEHRGRELLGAQRLQAAAERADPRAQRRDDRGPSHPCAFIGGVSVRRWMSGRRLPGSARITSTQPAAHATT